MSSDKDGSSKMDSEDKVNFVEMKLNCSQENDATHIREVSKGDSLTKKEAKITIDNISSLLGNMCFLGDQNKIEITQNDQKQEIINIVTIPEWLKDCECPFSWHLEQERGLGPELVILRISEKLDELLIEEPGFSLQRFVSLLKLVLEYYIIGDMNKCCENMKILDGCLEEEVSRNDPLYQKVKLSLGHVVSATKAHVLCIIGKEEESKKIGRCIIPTKIMGDTDKAALNSMKARFFLYSGYENGEEVGVNYAQKALELEPGNPEWEYLLAKMLRQQRRDVPFSKEVPRDELKLLESAVNRDKNPKYIVYLAQVYRECASQAFKQYKNHPNFREELQESVELMSTRALEHYKEALSLSPDSPVVLRRVGYGIMNLPKKFADYDLALDCLLKSLDISENQTTMHMLGTFYHKYRNDNKKALEYFERTAKTGSWFGLSDMIRIKWILNHEYDPCPDLEIGLSLKMKRKFHTQALAQLGGYHLFIKRDFYKAIEYFKQIIAEDKAGHVSPHMTSFKSFFLRMNEPINLYKYLANEALILVQKRDSSSTVEPESSEEEEAAAATQTGNPGYVEDFLDLISEVHPELMEMTPDTDLIPRLIQASRRIEYNCSRFNQGNFRGRDRGGKFPGNRGDNGGNRGGSGGNRGGSGGNRGGRRGNFSGNRGSRGGGQEDNERRGRFSSANQREQEPESGERRGEYGRNRNWRQKYENDGRGQSNQNQENWRRK